jgi:hypothetical protein
VAVMAAAKPAQPAPTMAICKRWLKVVQALALSMQAITYAKV